MAKKVGETVVISNVYLVGGVEEEKEELQFKDKYPNDLKITCFKTVSELIVHVFQMRLLQELHFENYRTLIIYKRNNNTTTTTTTTNNNNNNNTSTMSYEVDRLSVAQVRVLFSKMFGHLQFDIVGSDYKDDVGEFHRLNKMKYDPLLKNRLEKVKYWCFTPTCERPSSGTRSGSRSNNGSGSGSGSGGGGVCNGNLSSMYNQLATIVELESLESFSEEGDEEGDEEGGRVVPCELLAHLDLFSVVAPYFVSESRSSAATKVNRGIISKECFELVDNWGFSATNYSIGALIQLAFNMLYPLLETKEDGPEQAQKQLLLFIMIIECNYHQDNKFHNFKHAVDVLQAAWYLYRTLMGNQNLKPKMLLLLSLSAIGHDVGHPGTNNKIIAENNLLLLKDFYTNSDSVLEMYHCRVFWFILKDFHILVGGCQPNTHHMKDIVLATDMAKHKEYIDDLASSVQAEEGNDGYQQPGNGCGGAGGGAGAGSGNTRITNLLLTPASPLTNTAEKTQKQCDISEICQVRKQCLLVLELIMKAADISNVTRPLDVSTKWAYLICLEFAECDALQASSSGIPISTSLSVSTETVEVPDPTTMDECLKLQPGIPYGQLFFINTFANDLFTELSTKFPNHLAFLKENLTKNKTFWEKYIENNNNNNNNQK